ncbi:helix-turn-helix domain-containing protein [Leptolyngbya sp. KIOST-1]|uniref:helix-turn-helix domain-containing protein n=1 Tax=Leptolyngbya sp. KIOST-1 TaxID=1229172 RepID=UPI0009DD6A5F|nr:helix-turn-helix domain-containing protein [Leptolyngbya sp. KIOST-1]
MKSLQDPSPQPLQNTPPSAISLHQFQDIDELAVFLPEDVRLTPLECGPFRCESAALNLGTIHFNFNHVSRNLKAVGQKQRGFLSFSMILQSSGQHGIESSRFITEDYLFGFDANREADLIFPGGCTYCAVYIQPDTFDACTQTMDRLELDNKFLSCNYAYMPDSFPFLRTYLKQIYNLLVRRSPLLQKPDFQQLIVQDFLPLFIASLPTQQEHWTSAKFFRRSKLVKQADDYMRSHMDQALTLTDLCEALGTSTRALCYGFQEMFGISPMAYLKILRLQSSYRVLKASAPGARNVTDVATQFGFYHLGYFAKDYRQMFGELPSETLSRNK